MTQRVFRFAVQSFGAALYTVGHSSHATLGLLELLRAHGVSAVCDVRSVPYSRRHPQFNRETLRASLAAAGLAYVPLGDELGARARDPACYDAQGRVVFERLAGTALFRSGLERVLQGIRTHTVALMCAEGEPLACHRSILVCRELRRIAAELEIRHILPDGRAEPHAEAERRLVKWVGLGQGELFGAGEDVLDRAYARQAERIAWVRPAGPDSEAGP